MSQHDNSTPRGIDRKPATRAALLRRRSTLLLEQAQIDAQLAELESDNDVADDFTRANLPRDTSARVFRETCARGLVAGATKDGRSWRCSREAWFAARRSTPAPRLRLAAPVALSEAEAAERDLSAAGLRATTRRSA